MRDRLRYGMIVGLAVMLTVLGIYGVAEVWLDPSLPRWAKVTVTFFYLAVYWYMVVTPIRNWNARRRKEHRG